MCGIAGIWRFDGQQPGEERVMRFTNAMSHRGPDGWGYYGDDKAGIGLGHRRLSILDLSDAGKQPMSYAGDRYWITYNGEIFNFIEVRNELRTHGYIFITETDTEVILAAYHKWGKECLHKLNGMWAFAIWDREERTLFVARDRFGVKPLHYHYSNKQFSFASETIAFDYLDDYRKELDDDLFVRSIAASRMLEYTGKTFYKGLQQLKAGCCMLVKQGQPPREIRWWNTFDHLKPRNDSFEAQVADFKQLFFDACKIRLRSDVPLASALSGGIDSTSIYCSINRLMRAGNPGERIAAEWQKAFVAIFPNTPQDEFEYARQVVDYVNGSAIYVEPDYSGLSGEMISSIVKFDTITGTPINIVGNIYKSMRQNGITVSLDGHGSDELMYGYRASVASAYYEGYAHGDPRTGELMDIYLNMFVPEQRPKTAETLKKRAESIRSFTRRQDSLVGRLKRSLAPHPSNAGLGRLTSTEWLLKRNLPPVQFDGTPLPHWSGGELKLAEDFHVTEIPYNLRDFDRASMQHGVEIRMPFMDHRLVTFMFSLPPQSKLGRGFTKLILREAMKGIMPEPIRTRTLKIGLSAPLTNWFNGRLADFVKDEVSSEAFLKSNYWNGPLVRDFVIEKTNSQTWTDPDSDRFWPILNAHILLTHASK